MSAQAILRAVVEDPTSKLRLRAEAQAVIDLFEHLGIDDVEGAILFLLGQCVGLQDRIDQLEGRRP